MTADPKFSLVITHTPWVSERVASFEAMRKTLMASAESVGITPVSLLLDDRRPDELEWGVFKTLLYSRALRWAIEQEVTHHVFMTDDLHVYPRFWGALTAMVTAKLGKVIGLLSNAPGAAEVAAKGGGWYRCNSWVVGPAYVVPHAHLVAFEEWYSKVLCDDASPPQLGVYGGRRWYDDDSALNEWITHEGPGESWHPVPTIIEHRVDLPSLVGHGDIYSRERESWRATRAVVIRDGYDWEWRSTPSIWQDRNLCDAACWDVDGPMLPVGEPR